MALAKGTNSYVTVSEADTYFEDRLDVLAWTEAAETEKSKALVTATGMLDQLNWVGTAISISQMLSFPRSGTYFDPRMGASVTLDSETTPSRILVATYELAYHLLNNDGLLDQTGDIGKLSVGTIDLSSMRTAPIIPDIVKRTIKPLLVNAGSNAWFRAN